MLRRSPALGLVLLLAFFSIAGVQAASTTTQNFEVIARDPDVADEVARYAEHYREVVAEHWLDERLADWKKPCRIEIKLTGGEAGGVTSFAFRRGTLIDQEMSLEGRLDRIIASALPHEITHCVLASWFGGQLPRWADEGAALLSEDRRERLRHEGFASDLLSRQGHWSLREFFQIDEYPKDLKAYYGQAYSVSRFLVEIGGRSRFLAFLDDSRRYGWDRATQEHYRLTNLRELERAWQSWYQVASGTAIDAVALSNSER